METGSNITAYKGDANLGLGEDSNIPVVAERPELSAVNQAADQIRLFDHQNNIMRYQQKVKDRDNLLGMLAQGKVQSGKILPGDQQFYDEAEKAQTDAWKAIKSPTDKEGIANYLTKTQQLQDLVTNLQHRWAGVTGLEQEKAKQTLPKDIQSYADHIAKQVAKKPGELVDPYQKSFSGDFDEMAKQIRGTQMITKGSGGELPPLGSETKTTTTDKNGNVTTKVVEKPVVGLPKGTKSGISSTTTPTGSSLSIWQETPEKYYDYPTMLKRAEQLYLGDAEQQENQRQWFNKFHEAPAFMQQDLINKYNQRIRDYSQQRGLEPDANGRFSDEIKYRRTPDGKVLLEETPSSFAAKHTLATIEGDYVEKGQRMFNKDIANYLLENKKADADAIYKKGKLANDAMKARAYVANIHSQIKAREGEPEEQQKLLDDIWTRNLVQQSNLVLPIGGNKMGNAFIQNKNSLPLFTFNSQGKPTLLAPIGGKPLTDKSGKIIGYEGGHYQQQFVYNNRAADLQSLWSLYDAALPALKKQGFDGSFDDYLKGMIDQQVLDVKLIGANGSSDKKINTDALKAISNPLTKKDQEGVFEMPPPSEPEQ